MNAADDMVSSVEDLMGRLTVAEERKLSQSAEPETAIFMLGLPMPSEASNGELNRLKPIYIEILRDISQHEENSICLRPLFDIQDQGSSQDKAIMILYLLEYPSAVRSAREDVTGLAGCTSQEIFELVDFSDTISKNEVIGTWCRDAIAQHRKYHASVLTSALSLLAAMSGTNTLSKSQGKKLFRKIILRGDKDSKRAFDELRTDLAELCLSRTELVPQAVVNTIMLQLQLLVTLYDEDRAIEIMTNAPNKQPFEQALDRVKSTFQEREYQMFRVVLGSSATVEELKQAQQVPRNPVQKPFARCESKGCNKPGIKLCAQCKLVSYCSRDCQVGDWKAGGHKQVCQKKKVATMDSEKVQVAAAAARRKAIPALLLQERLLARSPGVDYVIVLPSGNKDVGVQFANPMGKMVFQLTRKKAHGSPNAVFRMYDMLIGVHANLKDIIRKQLQAEYGVDPLSSEAQNIGLQTSDSVTGEAVAAYMRSAGADLPVASHASALASALYHADKKKSQALQLQDSVLDQNRRCDYVVLGEEGEVDEGIEFFNREDKIEFRVARYQAPTTLSCVATMYDKLVALHPGIKDRIHGQMASEYGVDPASDAVQNASYIELEEEEEREMLREIQAKWSTAGTRGK